MPGTAEYGMQRIAETALEPVSSQTPVVFHVTDDRFDGASPVDRLFDRRRDAAFLAAEPDSNTGDGDTTIAFVDKDRFGQVIGQDADLLDRFRQGVTVVGIARHATHTDDQSFLVRGRHRHLDAKFIGLTRLALALARSLSVHVTATAGRAADLVNAATAERAARQDDGDELIPRLRAV